MTIQLKESFLQNKYFFIPFFIWCIVGAILLLSFDTHELFFAVNQRNSTIGDYINTSLSTYGRGDAIPLILVSILLIPAFRNRNYIGTTLIFGVLIPTIIYFSKMYFSTPRPLTVYGEPNVHTVPWLDNLYHTSFPSGHTLGAFGFFLLLSLYLPKHLKPWSILFFFLALGVGYSRLYLGQHFFADIYGGSIIGTLVTYLVFAFGKKYIS